MQARTRHIANLLLALALSLSWQYPSEAQYMRYGASRYPKILSAVEDSSGNFLLLNLQSKSFLAAPSIQYLAQADGRTIMVADFAGLVWNEDPRVLRPAH